MSDPCQRVRSVLDLYAEGELHDPASVEEVRVHLRACEACRGALELHDRLTRALLAGEPEDLMEDRIPWTQFERQRRLEGVLDRVFPVSSQGASSNGVTRPTLERPFPRSDRSRLGGCRADDGGTAGRPAGGGTYRRPLDAPRGADRSEDAPRVGGRPAGRRPGTGVDWRPARGRLAVAAAVLLGALSLWQALMPERSSPPEPVRLSGLAVPTLGADLGDPEPERREQSAPLAWVVGDEFPELALARVETDSTGMVRLYGVEYDDSPIGWAEETGFASSEDVGAASAEAEIEWIAEVVFADDPGWYRSGDALAEACYLLVPVVAGRDARILERVRWFRPARVERHPRDTARSRLRVNTSSVYRVCVYEGSRRLELARPEWRRDRWRTSPVLPHAVTFGDPAPSAPLPVPLDSLGGTWSEDPHDPRLRF